MSRVVFALATLVACVARPSRTQAPPWRDSLDHRLIVAARSITDLGYSLKGDPQVDSLSNQENGSFTVTLHAGTAYALVGVCDRDCADLDLELYDAAGQQVDADAERDAVPIVRVTPRETMRYRVKVIMMACGKNPCRYEIGVYGK